MKDGMRTKKRRKQRSSHVQRPAYRHSGAHSGGEKYLPGRQVNQGHSLITGGPHAETDLYSECTQCPRWHCISNINPVEEVRVCDGGEPFSNQQIL